MVEKIRLGEELRKESHFTREEVEILFTAIDVNGDGVVDKAELKNFLSAHLMLATQKEQELLLSKFDRDLDGRIRLSDLLTYFVGLN